MEAQKIALFGPGVSLELAKSEQQEEGWFEDLAVESLYREWLTAELLQLIHRSALRNLGSNDQISIYMVHNVKWVLERLQFELGLPQENLHEDRLFNPGLAGFEDKVRNFGQLAREYFDKVDIFNAVATVKAIDPTFNKLLEYHRNRPAVTDEANSVDTGDAPERG